MVRFIARGGMGEVYEVEDSFLQGTHVALKMILPQVATDPQMQRRFQQEVLLARKVTHPNLCPIYDIFYCENPSPPFSFLTMKLLSGETLAVRLRRPASIRREEAMAIYRQLISGVTAIHEAGVIHRDIKPNNVMLDGDGSGVHLWITDFGLAHLYESEMTLAPAGAVAGTPGYMAPELLAGQPPSQATDIFALGVVLHEVLSGEKPNVSADGCSALISVELKRTDIPSGFVHLVTQFLADDPKCRCEAFKLAQRMLGFESEGGDSTLSVRGFWTRRRFAGASIAAFGAAALGVGIKWDDLSDMLHPLPLKRFVALLNWPPVSEARVKPLLAGVINAIEGELARAEAFDQDLFVIKEGLDPHTTTAAQLNELRDRLGANLVLAASAVPNSSHLHVSLRVLDPASTRTIREKRISAPLDQPLSLPAKAVRAAAQLLNVKHYQTNDTRTNPDTRSAAAYAAFQAAEVLMSEDNDTGLDAAMEKYKLAVQLDPRYATAHAKLALAYLRYYVLHGETTAAALSLASENADTALSLNPDSVEAHLAMSVVAEQAGDKEGSFREIAKALSIDPTNPRTLLYNAQLYTRYNRWADAEATFARLRKLRPNSWLAHDELGVAYYLQGKYQQAITEFRSASLAAPKNARALNNLAYVYLVQEKFDEATDNAKKSLALKVDDLGCITMAALMRAQGKYSDAIRFAQKGVELNPSYGPNWLELGDCYSLPPVHRNDAQKAYHRAAEMQDEELRTDPANGPGWMVFALCRVKAGAPTGALDLIRRAEQCPAGDMDSQLCKARTLELLGKRDDALATVADCLRRGATDFQIQLLGDMGSLRKDARYKEIAKSDTPAISTNL